MKTVVLDRGYLKRTRAHNFLTRIISRVTALAERRSHRRILNKFSTHDPLKSLGKTCFLADFRGMKSKTCCQNNSLSQCLSENLYAAHSHRLQICINKKIFSGQPSNNESDFRANLTRENGDCLKCISNIEMNKLLKNQECQQPKTCLGLNLKIDLYETTIEAGGDEAENVGRGTKRSKKSTSNRNKSTEETMTQDKVVDSLIQGLVGKGQNKFMKDFNPKTSERVRRKKKKVQYYNDNSARYDKTGRGARGGQGKDVVRSCQAETPCIWCEDQIINPSPKCHHLHCCTQ
ncbi:unnamed protein product, partial [Meganyctiphanes norvegica]